MVSQESKKEDSNFYIITNRDVWNKLEQLEKKVDNLNIKIYAFAGALAIVATVLSMTGGIRIG